MNENITILVLAAGSSTRLGRPKQLLSFRGKTLIEHVVQECIDSDLGNVVVVLGANCEQIKPCIDGLMCGMIINDHWEKGLGESIAVGMKQVKEEVYGVILVLADQPYFTKEVLFKINAKRSISDAPVVVSNYGKAKGPPTYFNSAIFNELRQLTGDDGAKSVVKKYIAKVATINFPKGDLDIDTEKDLKILEDLM